MQVANNARAIEKHLKKRYEKQIEAVKEAAVTEADELMQEYEKQAKNVENTILVGAKNTAAALKTQTIAAAKTQARQNEQAALATLAHEVSQVVQKRYEDMSKQERKTVLEQFRKQVQENIKKRGLSIRDFEMSEDLDELYVKAENDEMLIEDGIQLRLTALREEVIREVRDKTL